MISRRIRFLMSFAVVWGLAPGATLARAAETISLSVDATKTQQKLLHAHLVMPVQPGPLTIYYPKWIPGEHGPDGPISSLTGLKFEAGGKVVPWKRDLLDVFTFHVDVPAGVTKLEASYDFIEPDGNSATDKLMVLEWNEVVLYPAGMPADQLSYEAKLTLPEGWKFGTPLPVASQAGNSVSFKPISLDLLVDSPVIAGEYYRAIDLTPAGEPIHHEIDMVADSEVALNMSPDIQKKMTDLVAESGKLFGARHYRDYHFLFTLSDHVAHFGLEHHESNDSRLPERTLLGPDAGMALGGLLSHEFVHSWNGKFRRPAYDAGISSGMKVVGVNGRVYTHDLLADAIKASKDGSQPISLLYIDDEFYKTATINYHGGERYAHLVRNDQVPDYLDDLITSKVGGQ